MTFCEPGTESVAWTWGSKDSALERFTGGLEKSLSGEIWSARDFN